MKGIEWIIEAQGCAPDALRNKLAVQQLFDALIEDLDLRVIGQIAWHRFPSPGGITGLCLLSESHLACHTFPEYGSLCLNLFCCRPRAEWDFESQLRVRFGARAVSVRRLDRPYVDNSITACERRHA
jgi:S-adenosylmethionine decarboxylase